ncbi:MAG TPA: hypothetical protein DHE23_25350, partial [Agrobacterium sp.]|nr:hypothetical protein [Agrobacterium sp.]
MQATKFDQQTDPTGGCPANTLFPSHPVVITTGHGTYIRFETIMVNANPGEERPISLLQVRPDGSAEDHGRYM